MQVSSPWGPVFRRLLQDSLRLRRAEDLLIQTWNYTLSTAHQLENVARQLGIKSTIFHIPEESFRPGRSATGSSALSGSLRQALSECDAFVSFPGPEDMPRWIVELGASGRRAFYEWTQRVVAVLAARRTPAAFFHPAFATPTSARVLGVSFDQWRRECVAASFVSPSMIRRRAQFVSRRLGHGRTVRVSHPNGTEVEVGLQSKPPVIHDGVVDSGDLRRGMNWTLVPTGVVIVPLDDAVGDGRFMGNRPSWHHRGVVQGIDWRFSGGRMVHSDAGPGREILRRSFRLARPGTVRVAMLSIGLNPRVRYAPFLEDLERGAVTLYVGHNEDFGGDSPGSLREWATLAGAQISIDGKFLNP
jgi:hypothetical protein